MLIGYPPFFSDSSTDTCKKILNWKNHLTIPPEPKISKEAIDLIKKLITDVDKRLGYNGAEEIKSHPFFRKINWNNLSTMQAPFIPNVKKMFIISYQAITMLNILTILMKRNHFIQKKQDQDQRKLTR